MSWKDQPLFGFDDFATLANVHHVVVSDDLVLCEGAAGIPHAPQPEASIALSAEDKAVCAQLGLSEDQFRKV